MEKYDYHIHQPPIHFASSYRMHHHAPLKQRVVSSTKREPLRCVGNVRDSYKKWNDNSMKNALEAVRKGESIWSAAIMYASLYAGISKGGYMSSSKALRLQYYYFHIVVNFGHNMILYLDIDSSFTIHFVCRLEQ